MILLSVVFSLIAELRCQCCVATTKDILAFNEAHTGSLHFTSKSPDNILSHDIFQAHSSGSKGLKLSCECMGTRLSKGQL